MHVLDAQKSMFRLILTPGSQNVSTRFMYSNLELFSKAFDE